MRTAAVLPILLAVLVAAALGALVAYAGPAPSVVCASAAGPVDQHGNGTTTAQTECR